MTAADTFVRRFGDLVALLRFDPGNDAAQELALAAALHALGASGGPVRVEAGVERSEPDETDSLRRRMLARGVDVLRVAADVEPEELLQLARALAHDVTPVPSTPRAAVELVPVLEPAPRLPVPAAPPSRRLAGERRRWTDRRADAPRRWRSAERRRGDRRTAGERRRDLAEALSRATAEQQARLARASARGDWPEALAAALELVRMGQRLPATARRMHRIAVRRELRRTTLDAIVGAALIQPRLQEPAAAVLRWAGTDGADVLVARLVGAVRPPAFVIETIATVPESLPLLIPVLASPRSEEVAIAAELLGRLGLDRAAPALAPLCAHADERVRTAAIRALGSLDGAPAAEPLRRALRHPSPPTRLAAIDAIAEWRGGALGLLLASVADEDARPEVRLAAVEALGRIRSPDARAALLAIAKRPLGLFGRARLRSLRAAAVRALERLDAESPAPVTATL